MKVALDPFLLSHLPLPEVVRTVADLGYEYMELGPRPDFIPMYVHPHAGDEAVRGLKKVLAETGVQLVNVTAGDYRWVSANEEDRQAAVRYWKRALEITAELECTTFHSELGGVPGAPEEGEAAFWRSLDALLPEHERLGIALNLQAHPYNFIETNDEAVDLIRGVNHPLVGYVFVAAHTFHLGDDIAHMIRYAGSDLKQVLLADSMNHKGSSGLRFIVNPAEAEVTVHQHLKMGDGEVDFEGLFAALAAVQFDGILTNNVFSQDENVRRIYEEDRTWTLDLLAKHGLSSGSTG